jgi:hypothetical protein
MRIVVSWDGSGHALATLRGIGDLFRPAAFEHIEVVLHIWPPVDIPRWEDIRAEQVLSDDLHQAAARTAADELAQLTTVLKPLTKSIAGRNEDGEFVDIIRAAVERTKAEMVFIAAGTRDASGHIEEAVMGVVQTSTVPTLVLRSPNAATKV